MSDEKRLGGPPGGIGGPDYHRGGVVTREALNPKPYGDPYETVPGVRMGCEKPDTNLSPDGAAFRCPL